MKEIRSLGSREGRALVREIFRELRFDKQLGGMATLGMMWRICTSEKELNRYSDYDLKVLHPLGFFAGSSLWMQEVVNRFYYSTINSFVYFGAAILLVMIGIRRFTNYVTDSAVLFSIGFEAFLLGLMFIVMFFSPTDEVSEDNFHVNSSDEEQQDILREIGEIGRDYATASYALEQAVVALRELAKENTELVYVVKSATEAATNAVAPNPELIERMSKTNSALGEFNQTLDRLVESTDKLRRDEIERAVRVEFERLIGQSLSSDK